MRPKKICFQKPGNNNGQGGSTQIRNMPNNINNNQGSNRLQKSLGSQTNTKHTQQHQTSYKEKDQTKADKNTFRESKSTKAQTQQQQHQQTRMQKSRKSIVRLVKKEERKGEKLPKINKESTIQYIDETETKRRVTALIQQAAGTITPSQLNSYPLIDTQGIGNAPGINQNSVSLSSKIEKKLEDGEISGIKTQRVVEHNQIKGVSINSSEYQQALLSKQNSPSKMIIPQDFHHLNFPKLIQELNQEKKLYNTINEKNDAAAQKSPLHSNGNKARTLKNLQTIIPQSQDPSSQEQQFSAKEVLARHYANAMLQFTSPDKKRAIPCQPSLATAGKNENEAHGEGNQFKENIIGRIQKQMDQNWVREEKGIVSRYSKNVGDHEVKVSGNGVVSKV